MAILCARPCALCGLYVERVARDAVTVNRPNDLWLCPRCGRPSEGRPGAQCPDDGAVLVPAQTMRAWPNDDRLGHVVAKKYALYDVLGRGGFGAVYAGWQEPPGRSVALKLLRRDVAHRPGVVERFYREAQVVASLSHPGTVALYDYGVDADGVLYMVFEQVRGRTLDELLEAEGGRLPVLRAARLIQGILEPLAEAHAKGAVHRDLKPANLMVHTDASGKDHVKVLDFGVSKVVDADSKQPITLMGNASFIGTPRYMSPEQAQGLDIDGRADLYSLGVIFYELLAGHVPFDARSPFATLLAHQESPVPPMPDDLQLPREVVQIVHQALAKQPEARFTDAMAMHRALSAVIDPQKPPQPRASINQWAQPKKVAPPARLSWQMGALIFVVFCLLTVGIALWVLQWTAPDSAAPVELTPDASAAARAAQGGE